MSETVGQTEKSEYKYKKVKTKYVEKVFEYKIKDLIMEMLCL